MSDTTVFVLHRKSANEEYIKEAVRTVRREGNKFRVLVPFNKKEKPKIVREALERGATRIIAGGGFDVAPAAKLDDGLLDITAIRVDKGIDLASIRAELENPMDPSNKHVAYRQLAEFTLESDQKLHCNLDGEPVHTKKLHFSVLPKRLRVAY